MSQSYERLSAGKGFSKSSAVFNVDAQSYRSVERVLQKLFNLFRKLSTNRLIHYGTKKLRTPKDFLKKQYKHQIVYHFEFKLNLFSNNASLLFLLF